MRRVLLTILVAAAAATASGAAFGAGEPLQTTPVGRLPFPERGFVVDLPPGLVASRSAFHVKSGEYFAPTGHTGEHVSLRQQTARPP